MEEQNNQSVNRLSEDHQYLEQQLNENGFSEDSWWANKKNILIFTVGFFVFLFSGVMFYINQNLYQEGFGEKEKEFSFEIVAQQCDDSRIISLVKVNKDIIGTTTITIKDEYNNNYNKKEFIYSDYALYSNKNEIIQLEHGISFVVFMVTKNMSQTKRLVS